MGNLLSVKQQQFNAAMERYTRQPVYKWLGKIVAVVIMSMQAVLVWKAFSQPVGIGAHGLVFLGAFVAADLINGVVHMIMDNNAMYENAVGPLVAAFHLHHRTPTYKRLDLLRVYFNETGSKIWLAAFLLLVAPAVWLDVLPNVLVYGLMYFAVLSSLAEISHYLCHVSQSRTARFLAQIGLLMSKPRHRRHHTEDNINYAFLNAMTDPVLDWIARRVYPAGYKQNTDLHYARYQGADTENRS